MPLFDLQLDNEILTDSSVPISGVVNSLPPSAIGRTSAADAENRHTGMDALNRPRPGLYRLKHIVNAWDSLHHYGGGQFLANAADNWYHYDHRNIVLSSVSGGPAFSLGDQVYSALANTILYFSRGGNLYKYDPTTGFATVTLPTQYPTARYPIWACNRLIYAWFNTIVCSDVLNPEHFDIITSTLTIDPVASDVITGIVLWQNQRIIMFRNGSTWVADSGPGLAVSDWTLNRINGKIGCRAHGSIVQCENDIYFLSETGRGIYAISQAPASEQEGIWVPISNDISDYINRINWSACDNVRATYWNGLYLIAVPLDDSLFNNFILVYSVTLKTWQGTWCFDYAGTDIGYRDFATDRTDPDQTVLLLATIDGIISRLTYSVEQQWFDRNEDNSRYYYNSRLLSRAFTFGEQINRVRPHSVRIQFLDSDDPVLVTVIADRTIEIMKKTVDTTGYKLSLTIPGFPFDLDTEGFCVQPIGLLKTGYCHELQVEFDGPGNWVVYQLKAAAFEVSPQLMI